MALISFYSTWIVSEFDKRALRWLNPVHLMLFLVLILEKNIIKLTKDNYI